MRPEGMTPEEIESEKAAIVDRMGRRSAMFFWFSLAVFVFFSASLIWWP